MPAVTTGPCGDSESRVSEKQHVSGMLNIKHVLESVKQIIVSQGSITATVVTIHDP